MVLKEGYSATAPDLAPLVTKLKRARPDVIFHTGYNPDISLFLRQARELGLRFNALIGHGAGYGVYDKLKEALGKDVNYFFNVDPISIWLANEKALKPELLPLIKMVGDEYEKARPGTTVRSAHVGMAASNTYVLMTEVLPRAIKKYGGIDADSLRKAALEVNLPEGGTMLGLRGQVRGRGLAHGRAERARLPGDRAVRGRQAVRGLAQEPAAPRAGAEAARPPRPTRRSDAAGPRDRVIAPC